MTRSTGRKCAAKAPIEPPPDAPVSTITLGEEEPQTAPPNAVLQETSCPLRPLLLTPERVELDTPNEATPIDNTQEDIVQEAMQDAEPGKEKGKEPALDWSEEMKEQLVDTLFEVFEAGGRSDNSFKRAIFEQAAKNVRKAYKGTVTVTADKCKNKWAGFKKK